MLKLLEYKIKYDYEICWNYRNIKLIKTAYQVNSSWHKFIVFNI